MTDDGEWVICPNCQGEGVTEDALYVCPDCDGDGEVAR